MIHETFVDTYLTNSGPDILQQAMMNDIGGQQKTSFKIISSKQTYSGVSVVVAPPTTAGQNNQSQEIDTDALHGLFNIGKYH